MLKEKLSRNDGFSKPREQMGSRKCQCGGRGDRLFYFLHFESFHSPWHQLSGTDCVACFGLYPRHRVEYRPPLRHVNRISRGTRTLAVSIMWRHLAVLVVELIDMVGAGSVLEKTCIEFLEEARDQ